MASSPAGSVESEFWLGDGDADAGDAAAGDVQGDGNGGFDTMEAAHAAVDRYICMQSLLWCIFCFRTLHVVYMSCI